MINDNKYKVIKFVQELILDGRSQSNISPAMITEKIDMVLRMMPSWSEGLDKNAIIDELIFRFSLWLGQDSALSSEEGHVKWLDAARKTDWRYWQRYSEWLEEKLSWKAVDALDQSTDKILGFLEDPSRQDPWDRRGLVVGHVQSGKTGSYTGLICKAADAGYKIIIVLAGMHNNLRAQTQIRLDEGFLGFATNPNPEIVEFIGVGKNGRDAGIKPNCATNRSNKGDFNRKVASHLAITPEERPWLFVVKKNKTVLKQLHDWVSNHVANTVDHTTGKKIVSHLPLLIIDDEADNASVDTGEQIFSADGTPDENHQPKAINSLIRKILYSFKRSAYVGYTATPFANIFIHERGATKEEGPDLFPSAFIINLAAPSNYVGPAKVFGLSTIDGRTGLPLIRNIKDYVTKDLDIGWMPPKHKVDHFPLFEGEAKLPSSLIEAIDAFLLTCTARKLRGQGDEHSSMLVHVTRLNLVQQKVYDQVSDHILHLRQRVVRRIDHEAIFARIKSIWINDFIPTSLSINKSEGMLTWESIEPLLADVISDIEVKMINGTAKDALDYAENEGKGLKVIAIGGDKLARGLTLEGLSVSYFLRASKMYDTLMQMGRWFGYRPDYLDLCRLYTTVELSDWFGHIADASEELREEFDLMTSTGATPRDFGLKVQSHPVLMVTSRLKMRTAKNLMLSFSGQILQTVALFKEKNELAINIQVTKKLIENIGSPHEVDPIRKRGTKIDQWNGYLWSKISSVHIIDFLSFYITHPAAYKVNSSMLSEFIQSMNSHGELTDWTVMVVGLSKGKEFEIATGLNVFKNKRTADKQIIDRYSIGTLLDPKDEAIDLDESQWIAALEITKSSKKADPARSIDYKEPEMPNGPSVRRVRGLGGTGVEAHPEKGLLIIYALDPIEAEISLPNEVPAIIAFGISFPESKAGLKVNYKVTNILWEQEYGPSE